MGTHPFDVGVIGGGPAGSATALALARLGYRVALVEGSHYDSVRVGETLPPAIRKLLIRLGVWERFLEQKHSPSFGIRCCWGGEDSYSNDFIFNPYGPGWHVDRARFDSMLALAARDAGAEVWLGARLESVVQGSGAEWRIEAGRAAKRIRLRSKFLVDATGRASAIGRRLGARRLIYDRLVGAVRFCSIRAGVRDSLTLIEAVEHGWWYSAVLPDGRLIAAFMTDADLLPRDLKAGGSAWEQLLRNARLTSAPLDGGGIGNIAIRSARSSRLDRAAGAGWLAVGDAAAAYDPLSSQGIYVGLDSGLRAAEAVHEHFKGDRKSCAAYASGVEAHFDRYLRRRAAYYAREQRWPDAPFWQSRSFVARVATQALLLG
ncbi:MAG TPA: tryptophan 7-halogenase [Bryobacteraceae bacterium]|nr:tryptophan 7-halogenase [Bryobacteraceae bacterium]